MLSIQTPSTVWSALSERVLGFLRASLTHLSLDGERVTGFRSPDSPALWIRDHSDMLRAGIYFREDVQDAVEAFAMTQKEDGRVFDYVTTDAGTEPENWEKWVRVPVEADVEYRFVKAAYLAWQATGDDEWLADVLPNLERALTYSCTHPRRWDADHGLIKRPYTIDTWDFDYTAGRMPWLNFQITDDTFWGVMHADQSGFVEAADLLAGMLRHAGEGTRAERWERRSRDVRSRANSLLFNGRFYTHFHKLTPVSIDGVDESEQLSLSNPMAINRGMATREIATAILEEYRQRREQTGAFAEWFSIDPPFPPGIFGDDKLVPGAYVNGGIMPLVGGELARAAFEHGMEAYGVETLRRYAGMIEETGETYLWYFPDGRPSTVEESTSPEALPTEGWGSSAMLWACVTGLCGVQDESHSFRDVRLCPRWVAAGEDEAAVAMSYAASGAAFSYEYAHDPSAKTIRLEVKSEDTRLALHVLLPEGMRALDATWGGTSVDVISSRVGSSPYAELQGEVRGQANIEVRYGDS